MNFLGTDPIFIQIADYYERLIRLGALKEGEALPSVREVASYEGINPNTVARAFQLLVERGLVSSIEKKGYFVKKKDEKKSDDFLTKSLSCLLSDGYSIEEIKQALSNLEEKKK